MFFPFQSASEIGAFQANLAYAVGVTITHRLAMFSGLATPSAGLEQEALRMVTEKLDAAFEGAIAAGLATTALAGRMASGRVMPQHLADEGLKVTMAAVGPAVRRAAANARRLSRR